MTEDTELPQGKSINELGHDALWFALHSIIAIGVLIVMVFVVQMVHTSQASDGPKLLMTLCAFLVPLIAGFVIAKARHDDIARYVWIAGLIFFSIVCVWVLDLPTGPGLCEHCGAVDKLWRTFFSVDYGSGLMGGDGVLIGSWVPLALVGYAIGAKFGLDS
jgi:hypothetical protein